MKKLKKISLDKKSIVRLEDFELQKIEGGGSFDLYGCAVKTTPSDGCKPVTKKDPLPGVTAGTGGEPSGGCHP